MINRNILFIAITIIFLSSIFNISSDEHKNQTNDTKKDKKEVNETEIPTNKTINNKKILTDIILVNFVLDKNNIFVNEIISGYFEVNLSNVNTTFSALLNMDDLNYTEKVDINISGVYNFTPILFLNNGTYIITLVLDPDNLINEIDEDNNRLNLEINVTNFYNLTNQTELNITNQSNDNLNLTNMTLTNEITGYGTFDVRQTSKPNYQHYVYLNGILIQKVYGIDNKSLFYHNDFQRNIRLVTDDYGNIVQENYYESFGYNLYINNLVFNDRRFSGRSKDDSNLVYFGARYYNAEIGRFISVDPISNYREDGYSYVSNNPILFNDPDGREKKSNNQESQIIWKNEVTHNYYLKNQLTRDKNSIDPRINNNGALFVTGFSIVGLIVDNLNILQDVMKASETTRLHDNLMWNKFWSKYIPDSQKEQLRDSSKLGWTDEIMGISYRSSLAPERYTVYMEDVEYSMQKINTEREYFKFLAMVKFYQDPFGNIYFNEFSKEPLIEKQNTMYYDMLARVFKLNK